MAALTDVLKTNRGIVFGDDHPDPDVPGQLASQMNTLASAGVRVLFIEIFQDSQEHAAWLHAFHEQRDDADVEAMMAWLKKTGAYYPPRTPDAYIKLVEAARNAGIALAGLPATSKHPFTPIGETNPKWQDAVEKRMKDFPQDTKYAVFCGKDHTHAGNEENPGIDQARGIDQMLGIPCVMFASPVNSGKEGEHVLRTHGYIPNTYYLVPCQPKLGLVRKR